MKIKHKFNIEKIKQHIDTVGDVYGFKGWETKNGENKRYQGFSLTYNPNIQYDKDINFQTLGNPKNSLSQFFYSQTEEHSELKNSYYDTDSFTERTPASRLGYIDFVLRQFRRTVTRTRVMGICANELSDQQLKYYSAANYGNSEAGWHRDEPISHCLRINIPVTTADHFLFETEGQEPYHLDLGYLYSWDTNIPHRVYSTQKNESIRWNVVIGCNPWFDLKDGVWVKNEFHGKHPMQMILDGEILNKDFLDFENDSNSYSF